MKTRLFVGSLLVLLLSFSGAAGAGNVQTRQPFDEAEFNRFMADYPVATQWLTEKGARYGGVNSPWALSGMRYDRDFVQYLKEKGWDADRFFYLLDHVNMGLLTSRAEARNEDFRAQMDQQREQMATNRAEAQKRWQTQRQEQSRSSLETARAQWTAQRDRVANDPYLPPPQKQQILAQMDRSQPAGQTVTPEEQQAQMVQQQRAWLTEQKQQVMDNPTIPPPQKQAMVAQLDRSMEATNPPQEAARPPVNPNPAEQHAQMQAQHKQWIEQRMQEVRGNAMIPPAQKQQMLDQLQQSLQHMQAASQPKEPPGLLPSQESLLIKNNRKKLTDMFFPER